MVKKYDKCEKDERRRRILSDLFSGLKPEDVAQKFGVHRATVFRIKKTYKEKRTFKRKAGLGRKKVLKRGTKMRVKRLVDNFPSISMNKVKSYLNLSCHRRTIANYLKSIGYKNKKPRKIPLLSSDSQQKRFSWAQAHAEYDWDSVVFSDESSFWISSATGKVWIPQGKEITTEVQNHSGKVHCWGAIHSTGKIGLQIFEENMNADLYTRILDQSLLPNTRHIGNWVYQQDNDPKHRSNLAKVWFQKNSVKVLDWPSYSPDLNPIENVWGLLKTRVRQRHPTSVEELKTIIQDEWNNLELNSIYNIVASMPLRVQLCIERQGANLGY